MDTTILSSKGQVVLPQSIRKAHHWDAGVEFVVTEVDDGILLKPIKSFKSTTLKDLIGCTKYSGPKQSLDDMEAAIARGARERK